MHTLKSTRGKGTSKGSFSIVGSTFFVLCGLRIVSVDVF